MFKSGFVSIVGRANVGKSTLMNNIVGEKIAIMSDKPQTTRNTIQAVYTDEESQVVFLDTPGIHKPKNKLGEVMVKAASDALKNVDVILFVVDDSKSIGPGDRKISKSPIFSSIISPLEKPVIMLISVPNSNITCLHIPHGYVGKFFSELSLAIAIFSISRSPSDIDLNTAVLSAQFVPPKDAHSILHPV